MRQTSELARGRREKLAYSKLRRINAPHDKERRVRRGWEATALMFFMIALLIGSGVTTEEIGGVKLLVLAATAATLILLALFSGKRAMMHLPSKEE